MLNLDFNLFAEIVKQARADVANQPDAAKWNRAIDRAVELAESNPWIERDGNHGIIIAGSEGESYRANGQCGCKGYTSGHTHCKHRVLAKLVKRYDEALARQNSRPSYTQAVAEMMECFA